MKKAMLSPLCSAFVIPGLGQVVNQQLKKGVIMLAMVFVLFLTLSYHLYQVLSSIIKPGISDPDEPPMILEKIMSMEYKLLILLTIAFIVLWIYSIIDAFFVGRKQDAIDEGKGDRA